MHATVSMLLVVKHSRKILFVFLGGGGNAPTPGLADGIFSNLKSQFWLIKKGFVGIFYGHLVYFTAIWYMYVFEAI
jgi:hypothetical protein